jgi:hypothetical protein
MSLKVRVSLMGEDRLPDETWMKIKNKNREMLQREF